MENSLSSTVNPPFVALPNEKDIHDVVVRALKEDVGAGDLTANLIGASSHSESRLICREPAVLCGAAWFEMACNLVDGDLVLDWHRGDGDLLVSETAVCTVSGRSRSILTAERTAINFLQTLSGTATTTRNYVLQIEGTNTRVLDTRKTLPGMRLAQKYAVAIGGGQNHRIGLFDGVLIKENHIAAAGSIQAAVLQAREHAGDCQLLEVEVESLDQLNEAIDAGVTRIMLDNFDLEMMKKAVEINNGFAEIEVSGNVEISNMRSIAETGVNYISVGALTKHVRAIDFSLRMTNI
ncbi:MAG: carboxylating nicotinate-nucleotide diphosphorylase [Gammaproteobacteria bacterium]|nr:carboxylating nicotinate-nucleotide diphosphorylase [Gammaproteobacteria bacterium]